LGAGPQTPVVPLHGRIGDPIVFCEAEQTLFASFSRKRRHSFENLDEQHRQLDSSDVILFLTSCPLSFGKTCPGAAVMIVKNFTALWFSSEWCKVHY
jgi:hypothetical protein